MMSVLEATLFLNRSHSSKCYRNNNIKIIDTYIAQYPLIAQSAVQ